MSDIIIAALWIFGAEGVLILLIQLTAGKNDKLCQPPALDFLISLLTWIPWVVAFVLLGWPGLLGSLIGQLAALQVFNIVHTLIHRSHGPTIHATLNRLVGPVRNYIGLYMTLPALPIFLAIRCAQVFCYPVMIWALRFPAYNFGDWIQVSRHKFSGLVGHDLLWCLYCDWMTGVYSLGAEMLRNVESFWCPIRFYSEKKCDNCRKEFPDISEWVPHNGTMSEVTRLLEAKYPPESKVPQSWYGHPDRKA